MEQPHNNPIAKAIARCDVDEVTRLVAAGLPVDQTDARGWTALHRSSDLGNDVICSVLLSQGANIQVTTRHGRTALHLAKERGHECVAQVLLNHGAVIDARDKQGSDFL